MDFNFARLFITIRLEANAPDSCVLFNVRKEFAAAFRQVVDCRCDSCDACPQTATCPYYRTFAQKVSSDPAAVKRYQKPPLPFIFDVPVIPSLPNKGTELEVGLVLVGSAIDYLDFYMAAFRRMLQKDGGSPIGASIRRVTSVDYAGNRHLLQEREGRWAYGGIPLLSVEGLCSSIPLPMDSIAIDLETPLRIIHDGSPLREVSFSVIARALMRRVSAMAYYYGGDDSELDFKWLAMKSKTVRVVQNGFSWVDWGKGVSGVIGNGTFAGGMAEFHPFLLAGEYVHVGKGASFGLGRFRLERDR